ncbi:hypothetical protein BH09BAC1_BH09BAC1_10750 [soil metagenome]
MDLSFPIVAAIMFGYLFFAIAFGVYVSKIEDEKARKRAWNIFIGLNTILVVGSLTYVYIRYM